MSASHNEISSKNYARSTITLPIIFNNQIAKTVSVLLSRMIHHWYLLLLSGMFMMKRQKS